MSRLISRFVIWIAVACVCGICPAQTSQRPNVILIMTDNHGAWTLGCYGNRDIRTPNIDSLAAEGTLFTRAFASNPVCSPTRATCLTGLIPSQHGVHSFLSGGGLQTGPDARCTLDNLTSLPEILRDDGYKCGLVGKWHLGGNLSPQEGLDNYWITMPHGGTSTFYNARVIENGKIRNEPKYLTDLWTEHAVDFIQQQSANDDPFFLFLSYNGPYALSRLLLRDGQNRHAAYYADKELPSFPRQATHPWQLNNRDFINNPVSIRRVATEVSGVDDGVGDVLSTLKQQGIDDNTIVIFIADQGWVGGHGGFFGMGDHTRPLTARDGMMQIPLIFRHPGKIAAGKRSDQMIANYDLMPTLLGHLNLGNKMPTAPRSPGSDFSAALTGKDENVSRPVFYEFENLRCVRDERFKYVHRHPNGPHELYDLHNDGDEFNNLVNDPAWASRREKMKRQLTTFFDDYAVPKYDMWHGGTSQVRIHDGIDEEISQLASVQPPPLTPGFQPADLRVPDGFTAELVAGPPLVTHPTLGCFDDRGHLYVCNNAGVNLSNQELEEQLPNSIRRLTDSDGDGRFDKSTVFADKMTFPMGGAWHNGSLYVASPPNIWKLTDTDDDGVADQRKVIVKQFGYTGNAASIHGCFWGTDGRLYWCDGYHGHEFKDDDGNVTSKREGSYLFSCLPDGSDVQIHCGGGMDNPVEVDLTETGDLLGTVNILYTRPRVDSLVHWLYGGAYPHREKVRNELKVTGDLLGPVHRFGHVAVSGMTRYRSGAMDHRWQDNLFTTFFNHGKVVRVEMQRQGSTYEATQHEFLSCDSRDFHPTDVIEDADGSLLVVDTGGWFYRGCPTSQFAKPDLLGGIYRIRRTGMTPLVDPYGRQIDWSTKTAQQLTRLLNDTRFAVREQAIGECVRRGSEMIATLKTHVVRGDVRIRRNCLWALTRLAQPSKTTSQDEVAAQATAAIQLALDDRLASIRQLACHGLGLSASTVNADLLSQRLADTDPAVRRAAATSLGKIGAADQIQALLDALIRAEDRSEEHAIVYALIEINQPTELSKLLTGPDWNDHPSQTRGVLVALDQMDASPLTESDVTPLLNSSDDALRDAALDVIGRHPQWKNAVADVVIAWLENKTLLNERSDAATSLIARLANEPRVAESIGLFLQNTQSPELEQLVWKSIASTSGRTIHPTWSTPLRNQLTSNNSNDIESALDVLAVSSDKTFSNLLDSIGQDQTKSPWLRLRAMRAAKNNAGPLTEPMFALAEQILRDGSAPQNAMALATALPSWKFNHQQLIQLTSHLKNASPMQLRELIRVFTRVRDPDVIDSFLATVGNASSFLTLPESELSDVVKRYPQKWLPVANQLLDRLKQNEQDKQTRLAGLLLNINQGDAQRGQKIFMSEKAKCTTCHVIGSLGKRVGPDLTTIGANRSASDLLESIVLPSASIVRDYGTVNVLTTDGKAVSGLLTSDVAGHVTIQQSTGQSITISRQDIQRMQPSAVSIMPKGLDEALTESELADVVAYLRGLR
ncbi:MAG: sulfatase-like hydrolase/transferase [Pirellulaceae bacterium]|nr:sulfatase-like hydrolase/transferase [Pirellulaceae bacterium]